MDEMSCKKSEVFIDGKCMSMKLSETEKQDILKDVKKWLNYDNILYIGLDIPLYKQYRGYIDFTSDPKYFEVMYRKR
jgi:hypothetical protein